MNRQTALELDFTIQGGIIRVHERENNSESVNHLKENKKHFTEQCRKLLGLYRKGIRLTRITAATEYNIRSLERRHKDLKDLKDPNINVTEEWVTDQKGRKLYKEYFLASAKNS